MPSWLPRGLADVVGFPPLRIAFLVVAALLVRYLVNRLIERAVRRSIGVHPPVRFKTAQALLEAASLPAERRKQRILALASLVRSAATVLIVVITTLMILAELGFNVTSIVAGTSVIAVTIAFGVQSLVKDLVSGVFMLFEDQLGVGDYVDMDKASGVVEQVGLRVTRLRDDDGNIWYVRNGEVLRVGNFSQGDGDGRPKPAEPAPEAG